MSSQLITIHPIFKDTVVDPDSENFIHCRRDGQKCDCISTCKRLEQNKNMSDNSRGQ